MSTRSTSRQVGRRAVAAVIALASATAALAVAPAGPAAAVPSGRGHAVVHVEINDLGFPSFTNGWKWSSVHGESISGFTGTRNGVGDYTIGFPGILGTVNPQLVPWGRAGVRNPPVCTIGGWRASATGASVDVLCFDAVTGRPAEGLGFDVMVTSEVSTEVEDFVYFTANVADPAAEYVVPSRGYWTSAVGVGRPTVSQTSTGVYDIHVQHSMEGGWPRVTAVADRARWCTPSRFGPDREVGMRLVVRCYGPGGVPRSSRFTVNVTAQDPLTGTMSPGANLRVNDPSATGVVTPTILNENNQTGTTANTHEKDGTGVTDVRMPEVRLTVPSSWVQAWGTTPNRCMAMAHLGSSLDPTAAGVRTRCVTPSGARADTRHTASRWDRPTNEPPV